MFDAGRVGVKLANHLITVRGCTAIIIVSYYLEQEMPINKVLKYPKKNKN